MRAMPIVAVVLALTADAAEAQFTQYIPPGGPQGKLEDKRTTLEREIANARFHLGPVRLSPRFSLHDGSWVEDPTGTGSGSDFTVSVGGGLRAYLRTGPKLFFTAHALPEYVYWQDLKDRRRFNQHFGAATYGYFNRLTLEVVATRDEEQRVVTPELLEPVSAREDRLETTAEVELAGTLAAFGSVALVRHESLVDRGDASPGARLLPSLDRREDVVRAGLRLHRGKGLSIGVGVESSQVDFLTGALDRSNSGTAPFAEVRVERPHLFTRANLALRSLSATGGARFVAYDKPTGGFELGARTGGHLEGMLYGSRNLVYSLLPEYSYLTDDRLGVSMSWKLGWRSSSRLFFEEGTSRYTAFSAATPRRSDDLTSYGASFQMTVGKSGTLILRAGRTRFNSNLPGFDRAVSSVSASVSWGGDL